MNKDIAKGKWNEVKGQLKGRWGRLTDDDLKRVEGRSEELAGVLQQRYGLAKEQAEKECNAFFENCNQGQAAQQGEGRSQQRPGQKPDRG